MSQNHKSPIVPGFTFKGKVDQVEEYILKTNKLRVLYLNRPGTKVVTTNITYLVGARDEARGETGLAHMLEHMLFKPTKADVELGIKSGKTMEFERETGAILNANTTKDRTTYYFSYPTEYFSEVVKMESERMTGVILNDKSLAPERDNVLSEFDMYAGEPTFALSVEMSAAAFHSHPYSHETIGFREDIEVYTAEKLEKFYRHYYRPDNAVLMIVGDIDVKTALKEVKENFSHITNPTTPIPRFSIREPKQSGTRRIEINKPTNTNIVAIGFKSAAFPSKDWFVNNIMLDVLAGGPESLLEKALIDSGKVTMVEASIETSCETSLASIFITLAPNQTHKKIESEALDIIRSFDKAKLNSLLTKAKAKMLTGEAFGRTSSLSIVHELTEYISTGNLEAYSQTAKILSSITVNDLTQALKANFTDNNLTIGYFIGKK